jgi:DNA repair exonuclease SbcCD ATPase subunit
MVRLREVTIIKDPSLLNEKLGPFKIRKILPLALGGMVGYGMIKKGTIDDIVIGIIVIGASLIISLGPDRSLSFENQLQAMTYYYTLKSKGLRVSTQQPQQTSQPSLKPEELELKISELKQQMKGEKDIIKKMKIKRELLSYELQYYTSEINNVEQRIQQLKAKMKDADKVTKSKISTKLRELYKKRSELYKLKNRVNAELRKFEKITLIDNEEINDLKKKIAELKSQIETTTDKKKLKELKEQYNITMLEYYNKKILQDRALLKLVNDKALKSKINAELKELYKKKSELEKKLKKSKIGTSQTSSGGIVKIFRFGGGKK